MAHFRATVHLYACMYVYTSAGRPIHQLHTGGAGAAIGADAVGALASRAQSGVLAFIHI